MTRSMGMNETRTTSNTLETGKSILTIDHDKGCVEKTYLDLEHFQNELEIYRLQPDFSPKLLDHNDIDTIILQYVPSVTLYQYITCEPSFDFSPIAKLQTRLHDIKREDSKALCHIDTNPRNYLYDGNHWWMIDFTDCMMDDPEVDAIHFLLFLASEYSETCFRKAARSYLRGFPDGYLRVDIWNERLAEWIDRFDERRRTFHKIEPSADVKINRLWLSFSDSDDYRTKIFPDPS